MSRVEPPAGSEDVCCPGERQLPPVPPGDLSLPPQPPRVRPPKHPHFTTLSSSTFDQPSTPCLHPVTPLVRPPRLHSTATCREMDSLASASNPHYIHTHTRALTQRARVSRTTVSRIPVRCVSEPPPTFSTIVSLTLLLSFSPFSRSSPFPPFLSYEARVSRVRTFREYSHGIERAFALSHSLVFSLSSTTPPETIAASSVPRLGWTMGSTDGRLLFVDPRRR